MQIIAPFGLPGASVSQVALFAGEAQPVAPRISVAFEELKAKVPAGGAK